MGESVLAGFHQVGIDELETEAIEGFLGHWSRMLYPEDPSGAESHRKELVEALRARVEIRRMARNPVMLTALAVVHWNERRLPEQRADLYESILTWLARSREQRPGEAGTGGPLPGVAGPSGSGHAEPAEGAADAGVERPRGRDRRAAIPRSRRRGTFGRAQEFLEQEEVDSGMVDSGIVVSRGSEVRFSHLTFQEYLAARAIAGCRKRPSRSCC